MNENILPYGSKLKPLLIYSNLSDSSLRNFINSKGIFLSDYNREKIIPLLVSSFISPEEFDLLKSLHKQKEEKIKRLTKRIKTKAKIDIVDALHDFEFDAENDSSFQNYNYDINPEFTVSEGIYNFPYAITRIDRAQDWTEHETKHTGNIKIKQNGDSLEVDLESNYTSPETKEINQTIINEITKHLQNKDLVEEKEKPTFIKFEDFSNENRFKFLTGFKTLDKDINFLSIDDIEFGPDNQKKDPPEDIGWIKDHIKKLILKGKKLEDIPYHTCPK